MNSRRGPDRLSTPIGHELNAPKMKNQLIQNTRLPQEVRSCRHRTELQKWNREEERKKMYSVVHPVVRMGIWFLVRGYWQHQQQSPSNTRSNTRNSSDEWHLLVWLASQGLHVHQLIQEVYEEEYQAKKEWDRAYKVKIPSTYDFAPLPFFLE
jgi:hypothetical protein